MDNIVFKEYFKIKQKIKDLEERRLELELQIMDCLDDENTTQAKLPFGDFYIMPKNIFEYSHNIKELQADLYTKKKEEEQQGIAKIKSSSRYVMMQKPGQALKFMGKKNG